MKTAKIVSLSLIMIIVAAVCHLWIDKPVALWVQEHLFGNVLWKQYAGDLPDLLFFLVCVISIGGWLIYRYRNKRGVHDSVTTFFLALACAAPIAYVLKMVLKLVFGRLAPREWLLQPERYGFHWFQGGGELSGFPSGHMLVFTAMAAVTWRFFPGWRNGCRAFLLLLGTALIATNYHFVGDVIAGLYAGIVIEAAVCAFTGRCETAAALHPRQIPDGEM